MMYLLVHSVDLWEFVWSSSSGVQLPSTEDWFVSIWGRSSSLTQQLSMQLWKRHTWNGEGRRKHPLSQPDQPSQPWWCMVKARSPSHPNLCWPLDFSHHFCPLFPRILQQLHQLTVCSSGCNYPSSIPTTYSLYKGCYSVSVCLNSFPFLAPN